MKRLIKKGVTLLELMVVVVIISILSTIAVGVYTKEVARARYSRARAEIRTLEIAITQYEVDTGQTPPSGSGITIGPTGIDIGGFAIGSGYLQLALRASLNGDPYDPLSTRWRGPYIDWDYNRLGDSNGNPITTTAGSTTPLGQIQLLDPFGSPYQYITAADYQARGGAPIPASNPLSTTETYFNPSTFQIYSFGADGIAATPPGTGDDVSNYESPDL